ncbi:MAG: 4-(cytidine 5'-diphospho)-2-C-methyl-D-erythritol kinase [Candidatus Dormibacteria bacterium]
MLRWGRAPAKLNLALELVGRRPDGFHLLRAVSQTIGFSDLVALELLAPGPDASPTQLTLLGPARAQVPDGEGNLALRAAAVLARSSRQIRVGRVVLEKRVPALAGLGGGSADAAAVLRLAAPGLAPAELSRLALECGADVPFSLLGGAARLEGVGELLTPLPSLGRGCFVLIVLQAVSTAAAYAASRPADFSDGQRVRALEALLRQGQGPEPELLGSGLEAAAGRVVPALIEQARRLRAATPGASWAMTGSGGAFFSYQQDPDRAAAVLAGVRRALPRAPARVVLPEPTRRGSGDGD